MQNLRPSGAGEPGEDKKASKPRPSGENGDERFDDEGPKDKAADREATRTSGRVGCLKGEGEDLDPSLLEQDGSGLYPVGSAAQKQIMFLESSLDEVMRQLRELTRENRKLKQQIGAMEGQVNCFITKEEVIQFHV